MKQYSVEECLISCILQKPELINEIYINIDALDKGITKSFITMLIKFYKEHKNLDPSIMINYINSDYGKKEFIRYYSELLDIEVIPSLFYEYQEEILKKHKNNKIKLEIKKFNDNKITEDELLENINTITNEVLIITQKNKITADEMLKVVRNKEKLIQFTRLSLLNEKLHIKMKTINVIGARPSEGKSALALNIFCDLLKKYKCIYFNMEMTEPEIYERMLGIESNIPISQIIEPITDYQNNAIKETANKIYNMKYEVINGSKTVLSMKNKIIKEQKEEHLIVFVDYVGYIVGKPNQTDKDRIGEAIRELNNITKDYNCTIFLIAQINRNGSDVPTMQDLKDSGEIEQTADTILLIHDKNKDNNDDVKEIDLLIPKCRGGKRNVKLTMKFDKPKQRIEIVN